MNAMLKPLLRLWNNASVPSGYTPGVTLGRLRQDLTELSCEAISPAHGVFQTPDNRLRFAARERTEAHLLMHLVFIEFELHVPAANERPLALALHHRGTWRRSGLGARHRQGDRHETRALLEKLHQPGALHEALMQLDFKRLLIQRQNGHWQVVIEHVGASEVVNRFPHFRRYIRLSPQQRHHLLEVLTHLGQALADLEKTTSPDTE